MARTRHWWEEKPIDFTELGVESSNADRYTLIASACGMVVAGLVVAAMYLQLDSAAVQSASRMFGVQLTSLSPPPDTTSIEQ